MHIDDFKDMTSEKADSSMISDAGGQEVSPNEPV